MDAKDVVIVVPTHTNRFNVFEEISLKQLFRVLGNYPIRFAVPESLDFRYDAGEGASYGIERFPDGCFRNMDAYNELCESPAFYERFADYEYMLIYQTDAFVFSDRLREFCDMGYDYIGAPVDISGAWSKLGLRVGNGGLSLRHIRRTAGVLRYRDELLASHPLGWQFAKCEDQYFAYCAKRPEFDYTAPNGKLAGCFSAQNDVCHAIRDIPKRGLPFGTHKWYRENYGVWKPFIERCGYRLPELRGSLFCDAPGLRPDEYWDELEWRRLRRFDWFFAAKAGTFPEEEKEAITAALGLSRGRSCSLWGAGMWGKRMARLLLSLGVGLRCIFDRAPTISGFLGVPVVRPGADALKNAGTILICSELYAEEIAGELETLAPGRERVDLVARYLAARPALAERCRERLPKLPGVTEKLVIDVAEGAGR